ncbi:hypothetical protein CN317_00885 [Bacillus cereus]|nr:hypothetical protein CN317_00885 [Bacillus cereus]
MFSADLYMIFLLSYTLLLGLKTIQNSLITDFTLLLSVLITIFNGIDGFYSHKELWTKDVITLSRLRELKRDSLSLEVLTSYKERLQNICNEDVSTWSNLKEGQSSTKDSSED